MQGARVGDLYELPHVSGHSHGVRGRPARGGISLGQCCTGVRRTGPAAHRRPQGATRSRGDVGARCAARRGGGASTTCWTGDARTGPLGSVRGASAGVRLRTRAGRRRRARAVARRASGDRRPGSAARAAPCRPGLARHGRPVGEPPRRHGGAASRGNGRGGGRRLHHGSDPRRGVPSPQSRWCP